MNVNVISSRRWCYKKNCSGDRFVFVAPTTGIAFFFSRHFVRVPGIRLWLISTAEKMLWSKWKECGERNECNFYIKIGVFVVIFWICIVFDANGEGGLGIFGMCDCPLPVFTQPDFVIIIRSAYIHRQQSGTQNPIVKNSKVSVFGLCRWNPPSVLWNNPYS